ncbi:MAG: methylated-DNA--[protein]-cysteine S-methyltransferase [Oscillospiraceae bacterium]|nr:methylated-DNA--[protein]-cysteine S-methyltransferase [Oscillospiraceae bacterium]
MFTMTYNSPIGSLYIAEQDGAITHLKFSPVDGAQKMTPLLQQCADQLDAYFGGELIRFDLPLAPHGTPFQMRVWEALQTIPYGATWSYKALAEAIDNPKACRAVGLANNRNPISILIPCHRVVGANGSLTGYGGGLSNKAYLLELEGVEIPVALSADIR